MRNIYTFALTLLLLILLTPSCERRQLELEDLNYASVIIEIDWSRTSLSPEEATVVFYPLNGSVRRYLYLSGGQKRTTAKLPAGDYSVIVINNKFEDFDAITFRNEDKYTLLEAYIKPVVSSDGYMRSAGEITGDTPDILASDSRDCFTVSQKMVEETRTSRALARSRGDNEAPPDLLLQPVEVVAETRLTVHIQNMYLIRNGSHFATLRGFAESVTLHNRKTTQTQITHLLKLPHAEYYPNDEKNGFMSDNFSVMGFSSSPQGERNPLYFTFQAVLRDKEMTQFSYEVEVTNLVKIDVVLGLKIKIDVGIDPGHDNPPVPIPPVEPDDSDAFKPDVDEWDEIEISKPMK